MGDGNGLAVDIAISDMSNSHGTIRADLVDLGMISADGVQEDLK